MMFDFIPSWVASALGTILIVLIFVQGFRLTSKGDNKKSSDSGKKE